MPVNPNTHQTDRINFVGQPEQRAAGSSKDQSFVNFFPSIIESPLNGGKRYRLLQRPGLVYNSSTATGAGRGTYYYNGSKFAVVGNQLYRNGSAIQTLSTSTGTVGFQEFAGTANYLVVLDGTSGWTVSATNVVVQITDADFPTPHVVQSAFMDGYLFVAQANTGDIYNCNLEDIFTWTTGNFISAEMFPDNIVAVCRQNNYVVALGSQTIEYFYDTGVFPGTPLARNPSALHQIGCAAPDTLVQVEEQIMFVGQTASGGRTVWAFNNFTPFEIAIEPVRQSLDAEGTNITNAKAFCVRVSGHRFYVINLTSITWVFDFDDRTWHRWADYGGSTKFNCDYASDHPAGSPMLLDRTTGYLYLLTSGVSTDATGVATTSNITSTLISTKYDYGTMNHKFMNRFSLIADVPNGSGSTSCTLAWSDDDYQTWSTARTITINDTMSYLTQLGMFRRRAFRLIYSQAYPLLLEGFETDINMGTK